MPFTLAFDVYGTLIDTHGVVYALRDVVGESAGAFSDTWRAKQLEYSFRRGLMRRYENFTVVTSQALDYCCEFYKVSLTDEQKGALLDVYRTLPAFDDVEDGLQSCAAAGCRLYAFSNGAAAAVETLLAAAGIREHFLDVVSTDEIRSFKPDPAVYAHFLQRAGVSGGDAWMISSNPFDVIGALSAGMQAAWIRRSRTAIFDPWETAPTLTVEGLSQLAETIGARH